MNTKDLIQMIRAIGIGMNLDPDLCVAIAGHESAFNPLACRYEPKWNYLYNVNKMAKLNLSSQETEIALQRMSFGVLQIMGSCARELKYTDPLPMLFQPELGIQYGCKKIAQFKEKYLQEIDLISAYNQGSAIRLPNGSYKNQAYVDDVVKRLALLRTIK